MKYWINTISQDHVVIGQTEGFVQAGHGKEAPLQKLQPGDYMLFYSPKTSLEQGTSVQAFIAVAKIKDGNPYQVVISDSFRPYRRDAEYETCQQVLIKPLIEQLEFITNKKHWGFRFKFGLFEINRHDFELIYNLMQKD